MSHPKSSATAGAGPARTALREALSAAVDDEAAELELRRVVNSLGEDAELSAEWERLHLIGATMRGARNPAPIPVAQRLWLQPNGAGARAARWTRWTWPVAGAAAAAVAALAVVFAFAPDGPAVPAPAIASAPTSTPANAQNYRRLASVPSDADLQRANAYMLRHVHQTSMSRSGAVPMPVGTVPLVKVLAVRSGDPPAPRAAASPGGER